MHGMDSACPHWRARMRLYEHTACIGAVQDSGGGSDACRRVQRGVDQPKGNGVKRESAHQDRNTRISRRAARQRSAQRASCVLARGEGPLIGLLQSNEEQPGLVWHVHHDQAHGEKGVGEEVELLALHPVPLALAAHRVPDLGREQRAVHQRSAATASQAVVYL